ncbi:hypothetical protein [Embleya sp. NPDC001921]
MEEESSIQLGASGTGGVSFSVRGQGRKRGEFEYDGSWLTRTLPSEKRVDLVCTTSFGGWHLNDTVGLLARRALDMASILGKGHYAVESFDDYVMWWMERGGTLSGIVSSSCLMRFDAVAHGERRDAQGKLIETVKTLHRWDPSYRYYRSAHLADNAQDAYRALWLAVESLLDLQCPQQTGQPEKVWLCEALSRGHAWDSLLAINAVNGQHGIHGKLVQRFYRRFYDNRRNTLFHSKRSKNIGEPDLSEPLSQLIVDFKELRRFYSELCRRLTSLQSGGGVLTDEGFRAAIQPLDERGLVLCVVIGSEERRFALEWNFGLSVPGREVFAARFLIRQGQVLKSHYRILFADSGEIVVEGSSVGVLEAVKDTRFSFRMIFIRESLIGRSVFPSG